MGLLAKVNPAATRESVIRCAIVFGAIAAIAYPIASIWNPELREWWPVLYPLAITLSAALGGLLEWQDDDGISIYEIVKEAEGEFGITIDDANIASIESVGDLFDEIQKGLSAQRHGQIANKLAESSVHWDRLRRLIVKQIGVDSDEVIPTARFHHELR